MMALPYITEHTGFTGTVYATEPTLQIGRYGDSVCVRVCVFWKLIVDFTEIDVLFCFFQIANGGAGQLHGESS